MIENKIVEVATLFGKNLGETFCVGWYGRPKLVRFDIGGLKYYDNLCDQWFYNEYMLQALLTGKIEIINDSIFSTKEV